MPELPTEEEADWVALLNPPAGAQASHCITPPLIVRAVVFDLKEGFVLIYILPKQSFVYTPTPGEVGTNHFFFSFEAQFVCIFLDLF